MKMLRETSGEKLESVARAAKTLTAHSRWLQLWGEFHKRTFKYEITREQRKTELERVTYYIFSFFFFFHIIEMDELKFHYRTDGRVNRLIFS